MLATPPVGLVTTRRRASPRRHTVRMSAQRPVRVVVVDDQRPFRFAAAAVLARMPGFELVGQAETGEEAVLVATRLRPDLVLMDVRLPGISGVAAAGQVAAARPGVVVILCSSYAPEDLPFDLAAPGVAGYLHKEELRADVLRDLWDGAAPPTVDVAAHEV